MISLKYTKEYYEKHWIKIISSFWACCCMASQSQAWNDKTHLAIAKAAGFGIVV